jgi:hypothetical protein
MPHVFQFTVSDGQFRGEDIKFCSDAQSLGYKCWLDPTIVLSHIGKKAFSAPLLDNVTRANGHLVFANSAPTNSADGDLPSVNSVTEENGYLVFSQ